MKVSDEGLTLETSALYSLWWPIYIFNLVDITKKKTRQLISEGQRNMTTKLKQIADINSGVLVIVIGPSGVQFITVIELSGLQFGLKS